MADNVVADAGSGGPTFATDDIGGVHYPVVKVAHGALDSHTLVSSTTPFPVVSASSGLISFSSTPTVTATGPVTITSGVVTLSSVHTITATAGTNPWSSAPGFNVPMVSASSGLLQISGTPTIIQSSAGFGPSYLGTISTAGFSPVTSSFGLLTQVSSGSVMSLSSGTMTLSSAPLVVVASSGGTQLVQSTAATNPWSSAPGFSVPIASASSGLVQLSSQISVTATAATNPWSSAPSFNVPIVTVSSGTVQMVSIPLTPVLRVVTSVGQISTGPGTLHWLSAYTTGITGVGAYMRLYDLTTNNATSSSSAGLAGAKILLKIASSVAGLPTRDQVDFGIVGAKFATACSFDLVAGATSTAGATAGWVSAIYTTSG